MPELIFVLVTMTRERVMRLKLSSMSSVSIKILGGWGDVGGIDRMLLN